MSFLVSVKGIISMSCITKSCVNDVIARTKEAGNLKNSFPHIMNSTIKSCVDNVKEKTKWSNQKMSHCRVNKKQIN
jgi:hypothetical protein